ncbi:HtaA domain-containing protein [Streptomyces sp. B1866]|uniref:HtaA domain-containing protein n=1 Tax=Streptomyces sp. B1866 TaxID=3075431 RepID=UPI00289226A1|nr:HtaA domain-containing protein [Streptomyces sp. B1866]MDT3400431.1 HtaA domain-containing protein [Streptomyces sp. B1866]
MPSRRQVRALPVALAAALLGLAVGAPPFPAAPARAESRTVAGGRLDWGIKASFQSYVTGPVAHGGWALAGGAATVGDSQFRFHSAKGSYDPDTGAFTAAYAGGVRFTGHRKPGGSYQLDLTISRPTVRVTRGSGTLYADITSKDRDTGRVTSARQAPLAALDLTGVDMRGGGPSVVLRGVPARLTAQGATAFAGYYPAGTQLDPVSLSADTAAPAPASQRPSPAPSGTSRPPAREGTFTEAAVDWGVRRTFREYVTGPIARGRWRLTEGAQDGGAVFRFTAGKGTYDRKAGTLDAAFRGTLAFTGRDLNLTISHVSVRVARGTGTLSADVADARTTRRHVPLVTFPAALPGAGARDLLTVTEAPAKLTAAGERALGGLYQTGTAMDPVSLAVALAPGARLPALPDLGTDPEPTAPAATPPSSPARAGGDDGPSTGTLAAAAGGGALAVAAVAALLLRRRARRTAPAGAAASPPDSGGD